MKKEPAVFLAILLAVGIFSIVQSPVLVHAATNLAVDGSSINGCSHSTNSCVTTLSTSHFNDTIIVYTFESLDLQISCTFSVSDTAGLSWHLRTQASGRNDGSTGGNRDQMAEFWTRSGAPLVSDSINESISGCAGGYGGEYNGLTVLGITGANINNPFDSNILVPGTASGYSNTPSTTISTSSPGDLIVGTALQSSYPIASGPGYTPLQSGWLNSVVEYKQTTSTVTGLPVTFGDNTTWYWEIITDAIQPASFTPPPPNPPPVLTLTPSLTVGTVYFPGDNAVAIVTVTSEGVPVSSTALQLTVTLTRPDNTIVVLSIASLGSGIFRSTYGLSRTALAGTYSIRAVAHLTGATDGSALGSFQVVLPGLSSQSSTAITLGIIASICAAVGAVLVSWHLGYFRKPQPNRPYLKKPRVRVSMDRQIQKESFTAIGDGRYGRTVF